MTYREAIAEGRRLYTEAMDKAANYALYISEEYGRPLQVVCKEVGGDGWNALRNRAQKLAKTAGQTADERALAIKKRTRAVAEAHAKSALKDPEQAAKVIASLPPEALENAYHEARMARAGIDRSPANRKAAEAATARFVQPIKRAIATTSAALGIQALEEALRDLQDAHEEHALTPRLIERAERLTNEIANLLMEAKFAEEVAT